MGGPENQRATALKGRPETGKFASGIFLWVTGDGHRGISPSGVGRSAFGSRLQVPAAIMGRVGTASRHSCILGRGATVSRPQ